MHRVKSKLEVLALPCNCIHLHKLQGYICNALNMMCARQRPHAQLSVAPNMMHTGTNQKAQQSCGSGTNRE